MQLPEGDRHTHTREFLEAQIAILMGGRVAEELFLRQMTSGAGNDIERATEIARRMVCEFGMSPLGPLAYRTRAVRGKPSAGAGDQRGDRAARGRRGARPGDARLRDRANHRRDPARLGPRAWPKSCWRSNRSTPTASRRFWPPTPPHKDLRHEAPGPCARDILPPPTQGGFDDRHRARERIRHHSRRRRHHHIRRRRGHAAGQGPQSAAAGQETTGRQPGGRELHGQRGLGRAGPLPRDGDAAERGHSS